MGVLNFMAAGAVGGAGQGIASYGLDLMKQADRTELENQRQADRMELLQARQAGAGASIKPTYAQELDQMADFLLGRSAGVLMRAGGTPPEQAADAQQIAAGKMPTRDVTLEPGRYTNPDRQDAAAAGPSSMSVPKYTDGQASQLMRDSLGSLRRSVGLMAVKSADDAAKADQTETETGLIRRAAEGDNSAASALLNTKGKGRYEGDGDVLTGAAPKGSVAESKITKNNADATESRAKAGEAGAHAGKYSAEAKKLLAETGGALAEGATQEKLHNLLNSLNNTSKDMDVQADPAMKASIAEARKKLIAKINEMGSSKAPAAAGRVDSGEAIKQARAAIARGANRDAVISRLKGMGIDTKGL